MHIPLLQAKIIGAQNDKDSLVPVLREIKIKSPKFADTKLVNISSHQRHSQHILTQPQHLPQHHPHQLHHPSGHQDQIRHQIGGPC